MVDAASEVLGPMASTPDTSCATSEPPSKAALTNGNRPRFLASDDSFAERLQPHRSGLPTFLYLLSFAPVFRIKSGSGHKKGGSWKETLAHPYVTYGFGTIAALLAGMVWPAFDILYGYWTTGITAAGATDDEIRARGRQAGWVMTVVAVVIFVTSWAFPICFSLASAELAERLRHTYFASVVVQDAAFFEDVGPGEISMRATKDIMKIRSAFGEKLGYLVWSSSTVVTALISSFINSPKLAGVLFSIVPLGILFFAILNRENHALGGPADSLEGQASSFIEQLFSSVRLVQSFNMAPSLITQLDKDLYKRLQRLSAKRSIIRSLEQAFIYFAMFLVYSLAFWRSSITSIYFGHWRAIVPHWTVIQDAMVSLREIRRQIEREPFIDVRDEGGIKLPETGWAPSFTLENVTFAYPSRRATPALNNVSVRIETGTVTALCGPSGSGKSTTAALLLREYDPGTANIPNNNDPVPEAAEDADEGGKVKKGEKARKQSDEEKAERPAECAALVKGCGRVLFAGRDIREYNLRWLRSQISVVSQNPQLFSATVFEDVAAGLTGTDYEYRPDIDGAADAPPDIKKRTAKIRELCSEAMRKAEAWQFVSKLPEGMDTMIAGGRTGVLSGGQRQRLAIARALVRKPACMLLDEATSALDTATEEKIRIMLEKELEECGMTIILIAHRLSTVAKARRIIVMNHGQVVDRGRYEELLDKERPDQTFRQLAISQRLGTGQDDEVRDELQEKQNDGSAVASPILDSLATDSASATSAWRQPDAVATADVLDLEEAVSPVIREYGERSTLRRLLTLLGSQKRLFTIGIVAGLVAGGSLPIAGWLTGEAIHCLSDNSARPGVNTWSLCFLIIAIVDLFIYFANIYFPEVASDNLVRKLSRDSLGALLKQEISFSDQADRSAGGLTAAVCSHPANVGAATGFASAQVLLLSVNLFASILAGLILDWKMAIVCVPSTLVLFFSGWFNVAMLERYERVTSAPTPTFATYVNEMTDSIKTVAALGREREIMRGFGLQTHSTPKGSRFLVLGCIALGVGPGVTLLTGALMFHWFSQRLADGATVRDVFAVFESIAIALMAATRLLTYVGDYARATHSFKTIQNWLRRRPKYATYHGSVHATDLSAQWASGDIILNRVEMRYPQRPQHPALRAIDLRFVAGQTHALCGVSGGGKTSIMALLQRFYDPTRGTITFGGVDHRQIPLEDLRASMAYVPQDSVLFGGTIRWNLSLGSLDPSAVTEEMIRNACEQAYIWDFICSLKDGLDTNVGMKGLSLSGGQRQRLCIARALIRDPKILLLDEATSALDGQAERSVQMALENARVGRTTIIIAHRLSTIRNSDVIHVIHEGRVCESGHHQQLLEKRGRYLELVQAQL